MTNARERQAKAIYEDAGYAVQLFYGRRYGETDGFGHCDFVAIRRDPPSTVFGQVKSGHQSGIGDWFQWAHAAIPDHAEAHFLNAFKRDGWRLCVRDGDGGYRVAHDERDGGCNMGEGLAGWLGE